MQGKYELTVADFLTAGINMTTQDIRVLFLRKSLYTVNLATHHYLTSIAAGARDSVATLTGKTVTGPVFDADDVAFVAVTAPAGDRCMVVYKHSGVEATSPLIMYDDEAPDLLTSPVIDALVNNTITIAWSNGANKIFSF